LDPAGPYKFSTFITILLISDKWNRKMENIKNQQSFYSAGINFTKVAKIS